MAIEKAIENDDIYITPSPTPDANATWAEAKELEVRKIILNNSIFWLYSCAKRMISSNCQCYA